VIRHRLLAAIIAAVIAVMAVTGVVVVSVLQYRLVAAIDEQLTDFANQRPRVLGSLQHDGNSATDSAFDVNHMTIVEVGPEGEIRSQFPSGPSSDPDALPDIGGLAAPFAPRFRSPTLRPPSPNPGGSCSPLAPALWPSSQPSCGSASDAACDPSTT
jgi:hypothetical protein